MLTSAYCEEITCIVKLYNLVNELAEQPRTSMTHTV